MRKDRYRFQLAYIVTQMIGLMTILKINMRSAIAVECYSDLKLPRPITDEVGDVFLHSLAASETLNALFIGG